ncbi:MAG TPA: lysophospholipid acyltransferase family protein [Methylomirabilota bacterium]|nr:lysophospholipid acyltransferase family protein [Methylomirabilota bacterium]
MPKRRWSQLALFEIVLPLVCLCPPALAFRALELVGAVQRRLAPERREMATRRTRALVGPMPPERLDQIVGDLFVNALVAQTEDLLLARARAEEVQRRVTVDGGHHLDRALDQGKGAILLGTHVGFSVLLCHVLRRRGYPLVRVGMTVGQGRVLRRMGGWAVARLSREIGRPQEEIVLRPKSPAGMLALQLKRMHTALRQNRIVITMGDGLVGTHRVPVTVLGRSVSLPSSWVTLARLSGAPVLPASMVRRRRTANFHLRVEPPLPDSVLEPIDPRDGVEAYARWLEAFIRRYPCHAVTLAWRRPGTGPIGASANAATLPEAFGD